MKHDSKETQMFSNLLSTKCCFKHTVLFKVIFPQRIMWMTSQAPFLQVHKLNECLRARKNWSVHDSCWSNNIDSKESEQKRIDTKRKLKVKIFWNLFLIRSVLFAFSMWTVLNSRVWVLRLLVDSMLQVWSWIETNSASTKLSKELQNADSIFSQWRCSTFSKSSSSCDTAFKNVWILFWSNWYCCRQVGPYFQNSRNKCREVTDMENPCTFNPSSAWKALVIL